MYNCTFTDQCSHYVLCFRGRTLIKDIVWIFKELKKIYQKNHIIWLWSKSTMGSDFDENCTVGDQCQKYRFVYRYTVLMYTTCTDGLYFCLHNCTLLYNLTLNTHTCGAHTMLRCSAENTTNSYRMRLTE